MLVVFSPWCSSLTEAEKADEKADAVKEPATAGLGHLNRETHGASFFRPQPGAACLQHLEMIQEGLECRDTRRRPANAEMTNERWMRTEDLYHAALALPVAERDAFLAKACPDDDALRQDVESLLKEAVDDAFLASSPIVTPAHLLAEAALGEMTGRTLGEYRLEAFLGAGGMGDVYRARDTTLERDVAIKILPRAFTSNPNRLARFEREARLLAAINHPHICAIHGIEEVEGLRFLVLELVEGRTLADTLAEAPRRSSESVGLPLEDGLCIAQQIANALEVAHEKGIIHRDLKPANIMITAAGVVKVLDFGLAKSVTSESRTGAAAHDRISGGTALGAVMGTDAYMSPEQASGKPVDRRTDIWAFGVVLFEMVTGQRPFLGETITETLAAVLKTEPDWAALPSTVPPEIRRLLRLCLQKDPKRRLQWIGDARVPIEDLLSGVAVEPVATSHSVVRRGSAVAWIVASALAAAIAGTVAWNLKTAELPVTRLGLTLPTGQRLDGSGGGHILALSPNSAQIAFVASPLAIYLRSMGKDGVTAISGTEGFRAVREPVFSPDGSSIAFYADLTLKRIAVEGGVPVTICPARTPFGISWGPDGIVFGQGADGIMRVSPAGGTPVRIARVQDNELAHGPQILPGGRQLLFTVATGTTADRWDNARIVVQSLESGERTTIIEGGSDARVCSQRSYRLRPRRKTLCRRLRSARSDVSGRPRTDRRGSQTICRELDRCSQRQHL